MKKIYSHIFAFFLILVSSHFFLFSQNSNSSKINLEDICNSLASNQNTTGNFIQTKYILTNGRKLVSSGNFIICNYGIMWKTLKPFPSTLILTEEKMIQISANGTKSVMNGNDNQIFSNISETLSSVFSGNVTKLEKNFLCDFKITNIENSNSDYIWSVILTPKDSTIASVIKTLELYGRYNSSKDKNAILDSLKMTEASNNTITYEFSNQQYPKELSSDDKQIFFSE